MSIKQISLQVSVYKKYGKLSSYKLSLFVFTATYIDLILLFTICQTYFENRSKSIESHLFIVVVESDFDSIFFD